MDPSPSQSATSSGQLHSLAASAARPPASIRTADGTETRTAAAKAELEECITYRPTLQGEEEFLYRLSRCVSHNMMVRAKDSAAPLITARSVAVEDSYYEYVIEDRAGPWPPLELFRIPMMLREGPLRGSFTVDGRPIYIPCRFRLAHDVPLLERTPCGGWSIEVRCTHRDAPGRSVSTFRMVQPVDLAKPREIYLPYEKKPFRYPLDAEQLLERGRTLDYAHKEVLPGWGPPTQELSDLVKFAAINILDIKLSHYVQGDTNMDLDDLAHQEVDTSLDLYLQLVHQTLSRFLGAKDSAAKITRAIHAALATGNWSAKRKGMSRPFLDMANQDAVHEAMRTIISRQTDARARHVKARQLPSDAFGFLCAASSKDGRGIGLAQSLAIGARVGATGNLWRRVWGTGTLQCRCGVGPGPLKPGLEELLPYPHLGYMALGTPHPHHNQGVRLSLAVSMRKQFVSATPAPLQALSSSSRETHQMFLGQRPAVPGPISIEEPSGVNVIVALMMDPMNQEDAIVVNRAAADRGLFRSLLYHRHKVIPPRDDGLLQSGRSAHDSHTGAGGPQGTPAVRAGPPRSKGLRGPAGAHGTCGPGAQAHRDTDGQREVVSGVRSGGAGVDIRGACGPAGLLVHEPEAAGPGHEVPVPKRRRTAPGEFAGLQAGEAGTVACEPAGTGDEACICTDLPLRVGDKLSNRHGQKGCVAELRAPEDMPFDPHTGTVPDLLVNPLCIPKRMTVGMLMEMSQVRCAPHSLVCRTPLLKCSVWARLWLWRESR